jgi:3-oxoacyl-[acyl-carrier protein] reductase
MSGGAEMRLANKIAIITGAGSGIGRASAYLFAQEGAKLVIADINDTGGKETVAKIKEKSHEAIFVHTDVSVAADVENLVKASKDKFGKMDILFNNAGIRMTPSPVEAIEESAWDHLYAINVKSVFLTAKYIVPEMKKSGNGVIINNASIGAIRPRMHTTAYASTKSAVIMLTKTLALELAPYNIRVNCINPVATETPMTAGFSKEHIKASISTIPLGRWGKPEDIAYAALYLASDESSMLTGASLNVDGGRSI